MKLLYILLFTIFTLGIFTACQQASTQTINQAKNSKASPTPEPEAQRISLKDAKAAYDAGTALIIDTRAAAAYNSEHIKGAINIPAGEMEQRYSELPRDKQLIFYCS